MELEISSKQKERRKYDISELRFSKMLFSGTSAQKKRNSYRDIHNAGEGEDKKNVKEN